MYKNGGLVEIQLGEAQVHQVHQVHWRAAQMGVEEALSIATGIGQG